MDSIQNPQPTSSTQKRRLEPSSSDDESIPSKIVNRNPDSFAKFIVLTSLDKEKPLTKISPFAIQKTIQSVSGDVKKVTKMRNGSLLVECIKQKQSKNLLSLTSILDTPVSSTPHRTLNYCQGIVRNRDHDLADISEEEICQELKPQNISKVKRFTKKANGQIIKLNTYLLTFALSSAPSHI